MGKTIGEIIGAILAALIRAIFGTDKATSYEVRQARPDVPLPVKSDAELLKELGLEKDKP
jgi:hypothetical protein